MIVVSCVFAASSLKMCLMHKRIELWLCCYEGQPNTRLRAENTLFFFFFFFFSGFIWFCFRCFRSRFLCDSTVQWARSLTWIEMRFCLFGILQYFASYCYSRVRLLAVVSQNTFDMEINSKHRHFSRFENVVRRRLVNTVNWLEW